MSDTTSKLIEFSNNQPKFTAIDDNSLIFARNSTFNSLTLPASKNTDSQYVLKINNEGDFYFSQFTVTTDMEVSQAPNQWILTGTDKTKLAANGILVATDNGAKAYTINLTSSELTGLKYDTTSKRISTQTIYQAPKDWKDASGNYLNKAGLVISTNNANNASILEVPSANSTYGVTKNSDNTIRFTQINNHSHSYYQLYVSKYQTTSDNVEDSCYLDAASKPYYVINESGEGTSQQTIARGMYHVDIDIDIVPHDLTLLQNKPFTLKIGLGSSYSESFEVDQKMANRVNLHISTLYRQEADGIFQITIGNASIPKCYRWDKIKLTMFYISS